MAAGLTKQDNAFTGTLATLAVKAKVTISPVEKSGDKAPDYRVDWRSIAMKE